MFSTLLLLFFVPPGYSLAPGDLLIATAHWYYALLDASSTAIFQANMPMALHLLREQRHLQALLAGPQQRSNYVALPIR